MRLLLDESIPTRFYRLLPQHSVSNVVREGWSGVKNGKLLALAAEAGFETFITVDKNLPYQQNLVKLPLAVVVLDASTNKLPALLPFVPKLEILLGSLMPCTYVLCSLE